MIQFIILCFSLMAFAEFKPMDPELTNFSYPFPVSFHEVSVKDQKFKMAYMDVKPKGKVKGNIILLHGKNFSGYYWEKTVYDLIKKDYRVLVPDQIGFGKSSKPESFPYTFQLLATFTRELAQKLDIKHYQLVGHSMGGMLATRMALM